MFERLARERTRRVAEVVQADDVTPEMPGGQRETLHASKQQHRTQVARGVHDGLRQPTPDDTMLIVVLTRKVPTRLFQDFASATGPVPSLLDDISQ